MHRSRVRLVLASAILSTLATAAATRAAAIPIAGGYTQGFTTLGTSSGAWTQESTIPGWSVYFVTSGAVGGGTATDATATIASAGGSATQGLYSWGVNGNANRSLGSLAGDTTPGGQVTGNARASVYYVLHLVNNTGSDISTTVAYTGVQWRAAANQASTQDLTFQYFVGSSPDNGSAPGFAGWSSDVAPLTFTATNTSASSSGTGTAGTSAPLVSTNLSATLPATIPAGSELFLRWRDTNDSGIDHGIGVDSVTVSYTTVPEPTSLAACGLAVATLTARRRRA